MAALVALPAGNAIAGGGSVGTGGGADTVAGSTAKLKRNGKAVPPANAPARVQRAIRAANSIDPKPYKYGGGHKRWKDRGYDCSGTVSYALGKYGARVLSSPIPSGSFGSWGKKGKGEWITVYYDSNHVFAVIAGLRLDTSQPDDGRRGPGWSKNIRAGFANVPRKSARHPRGL